LERHQSELKQTGLQLVAVAIGEPKHIKRYCRSLAPSLTCFAQNETEASRGYGLKQATFNQVVSLDVLKAGVRAFSKGAVGGPIIGDPRMLSGTFIIDRNGVVTYGYYSRDVSDHPSIEALIAAAS
jgi:hypothetical protein